MMDFVCNYAPIRFLPYRETGEFVNIGVAIFCPEIDWFDYRLEMRRSKRVHGFFPELELSILRASLASLDLELSRRRIANELQIYGNRLTRLEAKPRMLWFKDLIRQREALLHFGEPGVLIAKDPRDALNTLFLDLVRRQFAKPKEYQEVKMRAKLATWLQEWKFPYEKDKPVGDDEYHVRMPFVHMLNGAPAKVIKPFDLDKPDTSEIYNHGDQWVAKLRRLQERGHMPASVVFPVRMPTKHARLKAAKNICGALNELNVQIVEFGEREKLKLAAYVSDKSA